MFFTQEDYRKIEKWFLANSRKDTDFAGAATPLKGNETVVLVQNGKNVKASVKDVVEQLFLLGVSDFVNITDKYGESYISLSQAIELIPYRSRKIGQVVTFLDDTGKWAMFQFQGTRKNQWGTLSLWVDLIDLMTGLTITDSEDIVTETNSANQVALKFADKTYNEADYSGLGRVYLRKSIVNVEDPVTGNVVKMNYLTQSMISKENTTYIVQYSYNLNKQTISIPEGSILVFEGGDINNGTINCNGTVIVGKFGGNATITGTYSFQDAQADEEDITQSQSSVLKFKDKEYDEANFSGLGRTYLRKNIVNGVNILSQDMINNSNTIYHIQYDYNLNGQTITIPEGCVLRFNGGTISNGELKGNLLNDYLKPEWFGAKGDGITDDTKAIQMVINLNPNKLTLSFNKIYFTSNLSITESIKIEGNNSTLLFDTDCYATVNYHNNIISSVTNIEWTSSKPRISNIYINNTSNYKRGDIIKIYSDDLVEGTTFKQSQYFIVGNVYSDYIEVTGKTIFNFTTNIKVKLISNKKLEINNLTLSSLEHTYYNDRGLFTIIGGTYHNIKDCCIKNTNSHGFLFAGSYGYNIDNLELDYQDFINTTPQSIGMGIADSASSNFTVSFKGGYTQAFTCVYFTDDNYQETYGVSQFGNIKNSVTTGSALDNHTNCYNLVYSDSIISSSENGIVIRGNKCIYDNISVNAAIYGLYVYGDAHNTGNSIDFLVRNTNIYSHTRCVQIENNKEYKIKGTIENCSLEGRTAAVHLKNADIVFRNCTITGLITISNNVNVIFDNCTLNGYINIAEGIIDSNVIISNSICNFTNHSYFRECPATIENCTINMKGQYYIIVTLATNLVFSKVTFNTPYQYLLRAQNSARVELNSCIVNHTGTNAEFHVFRTINIAIDVTLQVIFNNVYVYNKSSQDTKVYLSYVDSWKGGSSINNIVRAVYIDNNKLSELNICNRTDRIMVINDILDNPEYAERGKINVDGTLKSKEVIVYRIEDIVPGLTDTIYKIVKDIDLGGISKGIPANCTLDFQGGSFSNGTITGNNTIVLPYGYKIQNVTLKGTFKYENGVNAISSDDICFNNEYDILDGRNLALKEIIGYNLQDDDYTILPQFDTIRNVNSVDGSFTGFPTSVIHNNLLYCFYYKAATHESTPGVQENIYYRYSTDKGVNWSDEKEWVLPASDSNSMFRSYRTAYAIPFGSNILFAIFCTTSTASTLAGSFTLLCEASIDESTHNITIINQVKVPLVGAEGNLIYNYTDATITNSMIVGGNIIKVGANYLLACYTSNRDNYIFSFDGTFTDNTHLTILDSMISTEFDYTEHTFIKFSDTNFYIALREDARRENTPIFKYNTSTSKFELFTYIDNAAYDGLDAILLNNNMAIIAGRDWRNYYTPTRFALINSSGKVFISNAKYYGDVLGRDCGYCSLQIIDNILINIFYLKRSQPNYNYGVVSRRIPIDTISNLIYY